MSFEGESGAGKTETAKAGGSREHVKFPQKSRNQMISASASSRKLSPLSGGGSFLEEA